MRKHCIMKVVVVRATTNFYDPMNLGEVPVRFSQALHVLSLLVEGTSDAYCCDKLCLSPGAGWTKQIRLLPLHGVVLAAPHDANGSVDTPA